MNEYSDRLTTSTGSFDSKAASKSRLTCEGLRATTGIGWSMTLELRGRADPAVPGREPAVPGREPAVTGREPEGPARVVSIACERDRLGAVAGGD